MDDEPEWPPPVADDEPEFPQPMGLRSWLTVIAALLLSLGVVYVYAKLGEPLKLPPR